MNGDTVRPAGRSRSRRRLSSEPTNSRSILRRPSPQRWVLYQTTTSGAVRLGCRGVRGERAIRPGSDRRRHRIRSDRRREVLGSERARDGVPLASVHGGIPSRIPSGMGRRGERVAPTRGHNGQALRVLTAKIFAAQDIFTTQWPVPTATSRAGRLIADESERSVLIDSVLHGRLFEQSSVWEAADYLRLPTEGPFVVIAAEVPAIGTEALPEIESKLRSIDVFSAWRLLPDVQVGSCTSRTTSSWTNVLALVSRMASNRVGVSARFDDLRDTAQALRFARVMLRGRPEPGQQVRCSTARYWPPRPSARPRSW